MRLCNRCRHSKSVDQFYWDKRYGRRRTVCIECCKANKGPNSGRRTPERRAEYRRKRGQASGDYVPRAIAMELAAARKAAKHDAHVRAWKHANSKPAPRHDAHVRQCARRKQTELWRIRYKTDPEFALQQRLRTQARKKAKLFPKLDDLIRDAINRGGESRTVADVCGYTIPELKRHLESKFRDGMDWGAFMRGEIHIDHIKPQRLFDLSSIENVRECWALSNLQPLWRRDNLLKAARWDGAGPVARACQKVLPGPF